jgi:hypothetical protein
MVLIVLFDHLARKCIVWMFGTWKESMVKKTTRMGVVIPAQFAEQTHLQR